MKLTTKQNDDLAVRKGKDLTPKEADRETLYRVRSAVGEKP